MLLAAPHARRVFLVLLIVGQLIVAGITPCEAGTVGSLDPYVGWSNGDGYPADVATVSPFGMAWKADGSLLIADADGNRIRRVDANTNIITTIAGTGVAGFTADGSVATATSMNSPRDIAADAAGTVYYTDTLNGRVRRIAASNQVVTTVASELQFPEGLDLAPDGSLLIADESGNKVYQVNTNGSNLHVVAGTGASGYNGDAQAATSAKLSGAADVVADATGNLYIADKWNCRVRRVDAATKIITTVVGTGECGLGGDGGLATLAKINVPVRLALAPQGRYLYIAEERGVRVRSFDLVTNLLTTAVGPTPLGRFVGPSGILLDSTGADLYVGDFGAGDIRVVPVRDGVAVGSLDPYVGWSNGDGYPADVAKVGPFGMAWKADGSLLIADADGNRIRRVDANTDIITTIAGTGVAGFTADGSVATATSMYSPRDVAADAGGTVYYTDTLNGRVRRISASNQVVTTVASGLQFPEGLDLAPDGSLLIADESGNKVYQVNTNGSNLHVVAGTGASGYNGDAQAATSAKLSGAADVVADATGNLYIADKWNCRVRRVDAATRIITTAVGTGECGLGGDGGLATLAKINVPVRLALAPQGRYLYIAEDSGVRVRSLDLVTNILTTAIGPTPLGRFNGPSGILFDPTGADIYVADYNAGDIRVASSGLAPVASPTPPPTPTQTPTLPPPPTGTPTAGPASLSGQVLYYSANRAVPNVDVMLDGSTTQMAQTTLTGQYTTGIASGPWMVNPEKAGDFGAGVSSLDAARVLQAVVGLQTFDPLQNLACDVTGDGNLSSLDAARILQLSVGMIDRFPVAEACGSDWIFVPEPSQLPNQQIVEPVVGSGVCQPGSISLDPLVGTATGQDFRAVLFGDCTGNWSSTAGAALRIAAPSSATVRAGRPRRARGGRVRVPIYVQTAQPFNALDVQLRYDPTEVRPLNVQLRSRTAGALVRHRIDGSGRMYISVASAEPVQNHSGAVLVAEFKAADPNARPTSVQVLAGSIDEQSANVANQSSRR